MLKEQEKHLNLRLRRLGIGNVPSWIDKLNQEGIEYVLGKFKTFWFKDNVRVYDQPPSIQIENILNELNTLEKTPEKTEQPTEHSEAQKVNNNAVIVPDEFTKDLLEKWRKLDTVDRLLMVQTTPKQMIRFKQKGKRQVPYVEGNYMQLEANMVFLFNWSDKIDGFHFSDQGVACYGSVSATINGVLTTHFAVGIDLQEYSREDKKPIFSQEELMKNAQTDMIKKALSKFGFNSDVYRGDV